ncbi:MAG: oligosaccharide flippase family protein [Candidatus Aminicenantes bacterium]|nr:oligosaccharide flippase family protein [Candidatus Aminicenantes bacterium]
MDRKHKIIKGAISLFMGKAATLVISSLQILIIPRLLGPASMGFFSYWLSVYFIIARILGMGGQQMMMKNVPELRLKKTSMITTLVSKAGLIKLPVFLVVAGGGLFFWTQEYLYFLIIALGALLFSLNLLGESVLYSFNKMGTYAFITVLRAASRVVLVIALFYVFADKGIVGGIFGAPLITFLLSTILVLKLIPNEKASLEKPFRHYFTFGFWIYMSVVVQGLIRWSITILAKSHGESMDVVGYFGVGTQICFTLVLLIYFINESILPSLIEFRIKDKNKFGRALQFAWKYTNVILCPLVIGGFILARPLIVYIIGKEYAAGTVIIKFFLPAVILLAWIKFHYQILFVFEKKISIFLTQIINVMFFVVSWFLLIRLDQIHWAPLSMAIGSFFAYLFILYHSHKIEKVSRYLPHLFKPLTAAALMGIIIHFFHVTSFVQLVGVVLLGAVSYGLFLVIVGGIEKDDRKLFEEFVSKMKKELLPGQKP